MVVTGGKSGDRMYAIFRALLALVFVVIVTTVSAQTTIYVIDAQDDQPVPFAQVSVTTIEADSLISRTSDAFGYVEFSAQEVSAEAKLLRVSASGFKQAIVPFVNDLRIRLEPDPAQLRDMVVTGQYGPTSTENTVQKVRVIDEEHMQKLAANTLGDALRNELNIQLSQDNILGTSMSMQGLSGENVKILIDGVPVVGRQNGNIDLSQIDLNGIARIEVVEGPSSVSYGTNALAGTINLITKKNASEKPNFKLVTYAEQIGRLNLWGTAAKRWGQHNLTLNLGREYFNGWNPGQTGVPDFSPALADTNRFQQWKPREQYTGRLNYRWNGAKWQFGYKGEASHDHITARGMPRAPYFESAFDEHYRTIRLDNAIFIDHFWKDGRKVNVIAAHNRYTRARTTYVRNLTDLGEQLLMTDGMQDTSHFTLSNFRMVYSSAEAGARLRYEFGTDMNYGTGAGQRIVTNATAAIADIALYTSIEYKPCSALMVRPAVRYAYNTVYGAPLIPSMNIRWQIDTAFTFRVSYARGFRAPSLKELYFYFVDVNHDIRGNENLSPEHSNNVNASLSWTKKREKATWRAELSVFYNSISDMITLAQVNETLYSYVNIGHYRTSGGNLGLGYESRSWAINAGANITGRNDDLGTAANSDGFSWSNEIRGSITKSWPKIGLAAQAFYKHQGQVANYVLGDDNTVYRSTISAYNMADVSVTKDLFKKHTSITAGCKNLFDVQNVNAANSGVGGVHGNGGATVPMMNGRLYFIRLTLELNGK